MTPARTILIAAALQDRQGHDAAFARDAAGRAEKG